ncbi:molybdate ABC transporter substrate-binding protein [Alteromonas confluentis]|uniref:Molybdate ABC transporter substrate-binding protein n=1 Tax=Alteromonas confluentis TaxID=1656094 RepID=A0A1E7ZBJ6_9ALTE|nr:molybdate ABC transporter substrate-binding protein [Alteromonas confluentis]OFC70870.1 molybdate ABC transporter substrate-binding protein [Alteromonas confluentis]
MNRWIVKALCVLVVMFNVFAHADEQQVNIAVAANFAQPVKHFAEAFEKKTGIKPIITVSSSGTLYAQIQHGAPFDVFLSADALRPEKLVAEGLAEKQTLRSYATGRLALVSRSGAPDSLNAFVSRKFDKPVAIANPKLAPYGLAASQALGTLPADTALPFRQVQGKNILQTYQYFTSGNVDDAFVAWSLVKRSNYSYLLIPDDYHAPIVQKMVIIKDSAHPYAARRFMQYLLSAKVQKSLMDWGYQSAGKR